MKNTAISVLFAASALVPMSYAQDDARLDSIVVTGTRIDSDSYDLQAMPNIRLRVPADFVLFEATFVNGDLDLQKRRTDLNAVYDQVLAADQARDDIELAIGDASESYPVESTTFSEVYNPYGQRGTFNIILRVDANAGESYDTVRARAEAFLEAIEEPGLVQFFMDDEQYIGLRDPERFRSDLVAAISDEVKSLRRSFNASDITVTGMELKTVTRPTGALSLDVYIPYTLKIVSKR